MNVTRETVSWLGGTADGVGERGRRAESEHEGLRRSAHREWGRERKRLGRGVEKRKGRSWNKSGKPDAEDEGGGEGISKSI